MLPVVDLMDGKGNQRRNLGAVDQRISRYNWTPIGSDVSFWRKVHAERIPCSVILVGERSLRLGELQDQLFVAEPRQTRGLIG
jgi:hypothetical protein